MRPLEIVLAIVNLLAFAARVVPLSGRARWLRGAAPVALLVAGAQWLIEGPRWQMGPAYALAGLFFCIWLVRTIRGPGRPTARAWTMPLGVGLGVIGLALAIALPAAFPVFRFPPPTGPYAIGTSTYHWIDRERPETLGGEPGALRELMVQVWYPAERVPSAERAPYVKHPAALAPLAHLLGLPAFTLGHLRYVTTNAVESAPIAAGKARYPVLIFSHGRAGYRQHDTWLVEELVSHGYVVAGIDHAYAAAGVVFPDGRLAAFDDRMLDRSFEDRMVPYLARDAVFTLGQLADLDRADPTGILTGRLDLHRAGMLGVSLGGQTTAEACRIEPRLRACLAMDVWMPQSVVEAGLRQPTMWITRDATTMRAEGWQEVYVERTLGTMRAVFGRLPEAGYIVSIPGMFHVDFSDARLLSPLTSWLGITGPIDAARAHDIVTAYTLAFFDRHLKGLPAALLDGSTARFPEVHFEARRVRGNGDLSPDSGDASIER